MCSYTRSQHHCEVCRDSFPLAVASLIQHTGLYGDWVANCYTVTNTRENRSY